MRVKSLVAAIALAALSFSARAQSSEGHVFSGAGTTSCGYYIEHGEDNAAAALFITWAQGFLSGANMAANVLANKDFVLLPDGASIKAYLDKYCRENPLESPSQGTIFLFRELQNRAVSRPSTSQSGN